MKKIGLIFDSSCGLTKKEANELGVGFIPLNITINDKEYKAGVDVNREELYSIMENKNTSVKTSSPIGESIEEAIDFILKDHEYALFIGISHKWSGTQNAVQAIVDSNDKYKGKVFVYKSLYSSPWNGLFMKDAIDLIENYDNPEEFIKVLDKANKYMVAYLSPGNIWWFYKGGRISKLQYLMGSIAKITPVLKFKDGAINEEGTIKARSVSKAMSVMTNSLHKDIQEMNNLNKSLYKVIALKTNNDILLEELIKAIEFDFGIPSSKIVVDQLSVEQIAHMGPNSFGIGLYVSLKDIVKADLD